jgi:hypothetical protein
VPYFYGCVLAAGCNEMLLNFSEKYGIPNSANMPHPMKNTLTSFATSRIFFFSRTEHFDHQILKLRFYYSDLIEDEI